MCIRTRDVLIAVCCLVIVLTAIPLFVVRFIDPWSEICCTHQEINIRTGQARYSRYIWYVKVFESVEDTAVSAALGDEPDVPELGPWHRANTFSPFVNHSPHYIYHAALHQARVLGQIFEVFKPSEEEKAAMARGLLKNWQEAQSDSDAGEYLQQLWERLEAGRKPEPSG